eukprot:4846845-Pyramimonas_sp.AAC.1
MKRKLHKRKLPESRADCRCLRSAPDLSPWRAECARGGARGAATGPGADPRNPHGAPCGRR